MKRKVVKEFVREFRIRDENDKIVAVTSSSEEAAKIINTQMSYIYKYGNTGNFFLNNKVEKKLYKVDYRKGWLLDIEPFVIPQKRRIRIVDQPGEVWKQIPGVPDCNWASTHGRFKVVDTMGNEMANTILGSKNNTNRTYYDVSLENPDGKVIRVRAHRALAKTFLDPDFPLFYEKGSSLVIDHIDNDSTNNNVSNLRITDQSTNILSALYDHNIKFGMKPKKVRCRETGIVYESASHASRAMGFDFNMAVANAANPNQAVKTAGYIEGLGKLHWDYITEEGEK